MRDFASVVGVRVAPGDVYVVAMVDLSSRRNYFFSMVGVGGVGNVLYIPSRGGMSAVSDRINGA